MAKVMMGCAHEEHEEQTLAGIVYTESAYRNAALPIRAFSEKSSCDLAGCLHEIVLTDYTELKLKEIDARLVVLAPFTVARDTDSTELARLGRRWKEDVDKVYPSRHRKDAMEVIGLFILRARKKITWHFKRRCIQPGCVTKARNMLDIPALSRLASLAPQHLKLPTYFCANP